MPLDQYGEFDPSDTLHGMEWVRVTARITDYRFMLDGMPMREENDLIVYRDPATIQPLGNWIASPPVVMNSLQTSPGAIRGPNLHLGLCDVTDHCSTGRSCENLCPRF